MDLDTWIVALEASYPKESERTKLALRKLDSDLRYRVEAYLKSAGSSWQSLLKVLTFYRGKTIPDQARLNWKGLFNSQGRTFWSHGRGTSS